MNISIMYGTESGNAESLADFLRKQLDDEHQIYVDDLANVDPSYLPTDQFYIFICSTFGDGELPSSAQPFAARLEKDQPDLSAIEFGIFGMGDSAFAGTFNFGPKLLTELLSTRGAKQVGERFEHDASGYVAMEDAIVPWAKEVLAAREAAS
ncbi:MAG: flavodoxin domain-containing protein [Pseudomonadota bacterium]